jgi:hypothetical protein
MFLGFIYGIASQDRDIDRIFLDNFISIACISSVEEAESLIRQLEVISNKFEIDFIIGISKSKQDLSEYLQNLVTVSL